MPDTSYATVAALETNLEIESEEQRNKLMEVVTDANAQVTRRLKKYGNSAPITEGDDYWADAKWCAIAYARAIWYEHIYLQEKSDYNMKRYAEKMATLENALQVEPTERQDIYIVERTDFAGERPIPLSQLGYAGGTPRHLYDGYSRGEE